MDPIGYSEKPPSSTIQAAGKAGKKGRWKVAFTLIPKWLKSRSGKVSGDKSFANNDWQVKPVLMNSQASVKTLNTRHKMDAAKNKGTVSEKSVNNHNKQQHLRARQEAYFKELKQHIAGVKTERGITSFEEKVRYEQARGHLTEIRSKELLSLANLKQIDIQMQEENNPTPYKEMLAMVPKLRNLQLLADFKQAMTVQSVKKTLPEFECMQLQGKLTAQLRKLAKQPDHAKGMTIELLKKLTGDYRTAKDVQLIVTKTLGFTPHKATGELEERFHKLRKG